MTLDNVRANCSTLLGYAARKISYHISSVSVSHILTPKLSIIISLLVTLAVRYVRSPWRSVPPGPKGLPLLGNALQLHDKSCMFRKDCKRDFRAPILSIPT